VLSVTDHLNALPPLLLLLLLQAGSKVVCVADGLPTWVCELIVAKPTIQEAIDFMQQIEQQLEIPVDPLPVTNGFSKH
jgi:carnosine synthase